MPMLYYIGKVEWMYVKLFPVLLLSTLQVIIKIHGAVLKDAFWEMASSNDENTTFLMKLSSLKKIYYLQCPNNPCFRNTVLDSR